MLRVVLGADGGLTVSRTAPGRGAWLCRGSAACLDEAIRRHAFQRAYGAPIENSATDRLRASLEHASEPVAPDVRG